MNTRKHIPQRTCIACRRVSTKRELIRLVRTADGIVEIDLSGKKAGRGAYLCWECAGSSLKGNRLGHALHTTVTGENMEALSKAVSELRLNVVH